ncbi:MAG: PaaI family thioesterase [Candidatus Obscuribacterales bacterium]|nr:PaaI family thioesterase [Candidatus Obscuribacterales bacterium]
MTKTYEWTMLSALGGEMLEVRPGYAKGRLPLTDQVKQPTGVFHAGSIVTLADEVASAAIHGGPVNADTLKGRLFPYSVQLSVNLITNDPDGPLTAESNVVREGGLTIVDTVVTTASGKTAALMRSVHKMVDLDKQGPHKRTSKS